MIDRVIFCKFIEPWYSIYYKDYVVLYTLVIVKLDGVRRTWHAWIYTNTEFKYILALWMHVYTIQWFCVYQFRNIINAKDI